MGLAYQENALSRQGKMPNCDAARASFPYNFPKWAPTNWTDQSLGSPVLAKCSLLSHPSPNKAPELNVDPPPQFGPGERDRNVKMRIKERPYSCHLEPHLAANKSSDDRISHRASLDKISQYVLDKNSQILYIKGKLLGKGGFAKCYKFTDLTNNSEFAAKIITKSQLVKTSHKEQVGREIEIHKALSHVNIVRLHSYFEDDSNLYIILEYCDNKTLVDLLKLRGTLTDGETRYFMRQILSAVGYLHALSILHRDLKLGNMFLTKHYQLKVGDFGLSSRVQDHNKKVSICGTPNYIAPEILQKTGHGFPADIWALGCIMYAMLVGKPPFESESLRETYHRISQNLYKIPANLSPLAKDLVSRLLIAQPASRIDLGSAASHAFFREPGTHIDTTQPAPDLRRQKWDQPILGSTAVTRLHDEPNGLSAYDQAKKKRHSGVICNGYAASRTNPSGNEDWLVPETSLGARIEKCERLTQAVLENHPSLVPARYPNQEFEAAVGGPRMPKLRRYSMVSAYPSGHIYTNNYAITQNVIPQTQTKVREIKPRPLSMIYPNSPQNQDQGYESCFCSGKASHKSSVSSVKKFFKPLDPKKLKSTLVQWVSQVKRQKTRKDKPGSTITDESESSHSIPRPRSRSILMAKPRWGFGKNESEKLRDIQSVAKSDFNKRYSCSLLGDDNYPPLGREAMMPCGVSIKNAYQNPPKRNDKQKVPALRQMTELQRQPVELITLARQEANFSAGGSSTNSSSSTYPSSGPSLLKKAESHSSGIVCPSPSSQGSSASQPDHGADGIAMVDSSGEVHDKGYERAGKFFGLEKGIKDLIGQTVKMRQRLQKEFIRTVIPTTSDVSGNNVDFADFLSKNVWQKVYDDEGRKKYIWVTKWIDYTEKYGFGYQLTDGLRAVIFNDGSRIHRTPENRVIIYDEHNFMVYDAFINPQLIAHFLPPNQGPSSEETRFTVVEKISILSYFSDFMEKNLIEGGDLSNQVNKLNHTHSHNQAPAQQHGHYVKEKWFVRRDTSNKDPSDDNSYALVMYLAHGVIQINFLTDHTKLILGSGSMSQGCGPWMIFIDSKRCIYPFPDLWRDCGGVLKLPVAASGEGSTPRTRRKSIEALSALEEKFRFALSKIQDLIKMHEFNETKSDGYLI